MSKKKWRRVRLADLADREIQEKILGVIARAPDPHKRTESKSPQAER